MAFVVPEEVETNRLHLRQFVDEDWGDIDEYFSDDEATKFTFGRVLTRGESKCAMDGMIDHWHRRGYGPYAMEEKASGKVIGTAGFWYPHDWPELEIKWALSRQHWGKGYASEAARAIQKVARKVFSDKPLISFIHSENVDSIRLALTIGAALEKQVEFRGHTWHIYRHPDE